MKMGGPARLDAVTGRRLVQCRLVRVVSDLAQSKPRRVCDQAVELPGDEPWPVAVPKYKRPDTVKLGSLELFERTDQILRERLDLLLLRRGEDCRRSRDRRGDGRLNVLR